MAHSKIAAQASKPKFSLWQHPNGYWCKKIRGRQVYFGKVANDPKGDAALKLYTDQREELEAGRDPRAAQRPKAGALVLGDLLNQHMDWKDRQLAAGEITRHTRKKYLTAGKILTEHFGRNRVVTSIEPTEFGPLRGRLTERYASVNSMCLLLQAIRSIFKYAYDSSLIDSTVRFGPEFKRPSNEAITKHEAKRGKRTMTREQITALLAKASVNGRAMILLGVNAGLEPNAIAQLELARVAADDGWLDYPRIKTGVARRVPLWPETRQAIRKVIAGRPKRIAPELAGMLFASQGNGEADRTWVIQRELQAAAKQAAVDDVQFYDLRRTLATVGGGALDPVALRSIMGHSTRGDMLAKYTREISDERLQAVAEYVRAWLFGSKAGTQGRKGAQHV